MSAQFFILFRDTHSNDVFLLVSYWSNPCGLVSKGILLIFMYSNVKRVSKVKQKELEVVGWNHRKGFNKRDKTKNSLVTSATTEGKKSKPPSYEVLDALEAVTQLNTRPLFSNCTWVSGWVFCSLTAGVPHPCNEISLQVFYPCRYLQSSQILG